MTYCNSISVAEHVVMTILGLVRNFIPSHQIVLDGGWNIADAVKRSYDLEGMQVGTVAAKPHRARRPAAGSPRSTWACTTPTATGCRRPSSRS